MLSQLMPSERLSQELQNVLQDQRVCSFFEVTRADLNTLRLAVSKQTAHLAPLQGGVCSPRKTGTVLCPPHLPQTVTSSRPQGRCPLGPAPAPLHQPRAILGHQHKACPLLGSALLPPAPSMPLPCPSDWQPGAEQGWGRVRTTAGAGAEPWPPCRLSQLRGQGLIAAVATCFQRLLWASLCQADRRSAEA